MLNMQHLDHSDVIVVSTLPLTGSYNTLAVMSGIGLQKGARRGSSTLCCRKSIACDCIPVVLG